MNGEQLGDLGRKMSDTRWVFIDNYGTLFSSRRKGVLLHHACDALWVHDTSCLWPCTQ